MKKRLHEKKKKSLVTSSYIIAETGNIRKPFPKVHISGF